VRHPRRCVSCRVCVLQYLAPGVRSVVFRPITMHRRNEGTGRDRAESREIEQIHSGQARTAGGARYYRSVASGAAPFDKSLERRFTTPGCLGAG